MTNSLRFLITLTAAAVLLLPGCSAAVPIPTTPTSELGSRATERPSFQTGITETPTHHASQSCTVTGFLNLRSAPRRSAAVIRVLEAGERVTVLDAGTWNKVTTRNRTGYIYSKFCK